MLRITEEIREAARRLLKAAELPEAQYYKTATRKRVVALASKLDPDDHERLTAIANGKRKQIDGRWWNEIHHVVVDQAKLAKIAALANDERNNPHQRAVAQTKLKEFKAKRPPGARPPSPPVPKTWAEWVAHRAEWDARRKPTAKSAKRQAAPVNTTRLLTPQTESVNTTKTAPANTNQAESSQPVNTTKVEPVNTTKPANTTKSRSADRHREPNRDRHSPGYMRDYMRRWRTARKPTG
jgi:hypothetical protein